MDIDKEQVWRKVSEWKDTACTYGKVSIMPSSILTHEQRSILQLRTWAERRW